MPAVLLYEPFAIKEIEFAVHKGAILELRQQCRLDRDPLLAEKLFPAGMEDNFDQSAMHWAVFNEDQVLVASSRMSVHRTISELPDRFLFSDIWHRELPAPVASLNRLSVATEFQGRGISAEMDQVRILKAHMIGCQSICGTAHGNRARKLIADGFLCHHSNLLSAVYGTNKGTGELQPLDFYYKYITGYTRYRSFQLPKIPQSETAFTE